MATLQNQITSPSELDELVGMVLLRAYIAGLLAQLDEARPGILMRECDEFLKSFDYVTALQDLRARYVPSLHVADNEQTHSTLYRVLGLTYRTKSESVAYHLAQVVLDPYIKEAKSGLDQRTMTPPNSVGSFSPLMSADQPIGVEPLTDAAFDDHLPKYTSMLYLEGQKCGETPKRSSSMLSYNPPQFQAAISFRGVERTGVAQSKKMARHLAAKALCQQLSITN